MGSIPGSGKSPGVEHGHPLQYSCLETPMDREPAGLQSTESQRDTTEQLSMVAFYVGARLINSVVLVSDVQ